MECTRAGEILPKEPDESCRDVRLCQSRVVLICAIALLLPTYIPKAEPTPGSVHGDSQSDIDKRQSNDVLEYSIGPGDVLDIVVWKEPDFSGQFMVRFDGKISLPLIGEVTVLLQTPEEFSKVLEEKISRYVESPRVTVSVAATNSAQFFVLGKVATQGAFPYTGRIRVVQALALAGGFQDFAKLDKIFVIRDAGTGQTYYPVNYEKLVNDRKLSSNIVILPGDTIIVP